VKAASVLVVLSVVFLMLCVLCWRFYCWGC